MKYTGTIARGIKGPIIAQGDNLSEIVIESLNNVCNHENIVIHDGDILCITESVVAISQGNIVNLDDITAEINEKFPNDSIGILFPVLSRNRFASILKAIARTSKRIFLQLSYPADEVGNKLIQEEDLIQHQINPYQDVFTLNDFRKIFPNTIHQFTNIDYIKFYQDIIGPTGTIIFSNNPSTILNYTKDVLVSNVHKRKSTINVLKQLGGNIILGLEHLLTEPKNNGGFNPQYGLLGSNVSSDEKIKLFPRDCFKITKEIQNKIKEVFNKHLEIMIYGDGAFKDPQGEIWELCDPVVSPGFTEGLIGTPNELKLKYLAAIHSQDLTKEELQMEIKKMIKEKTQEQNASLGTTPRQIVDLLGSLADLVSGSGDKGTPFVLIQNYFTNYASE